MRWTGGGTGALTQPYLLVFWVKDCGILREKILFSLLRSLSMFTLISSSILSTIDLYELMVHICDAWP